MEPEKKPLQNPPVVDENGLPVAETPTQTNPELSGLSDSGENSGSDPVVVGGTPSTDTDSTSVGNDTPSDAGSPVVPEDFSSTPASDPTSSDDDSFSPTSPSSTPSVVEAPPADPTDPAVAPPVTPEGQNDLGGPIPPSPVITDNSATPPVTPDAGSPDVHTPVPFGADGDKNKMMVRGLIGIVVVIVAAVLIYAVVAMM